MHNYEQSAGPGKPLCMITTDMILGTARVCTWGVHLEAVAVAAGAVFRIGCHFDLILQIVSGNDSCAAAGLPTMINCILSTVRSLLWSTTSFVLRKLTVCTVCTVYVPVQNVAKYEYSYRYVYTGNISTRVLHTVHTAPVNNDSFKIIDNNHKLLAYSK